MSDIKLFNLSQGKIRELKGKSVQIEKSLQSLMEENLETFLGVRFLATEHSTGPKHGGRIDTLGIDENNCPVIIEYKRATNENVINQGLFYLDWLMDHKAEFELLVQKKYGLEVSDKIEWGGTRLICIAGGYTKYDSYAVEQIPRNIELIKYKQYPDHLLFELVNHATNEPKSQQSVSKAKKYSTIAEFLEKADQQLKDKFEVIRAYILGLGDDVQEKELLYYYAYKKIQNFICVEVLNKVNTIVVHCQLDPKAIKLKEGFTRDLTGIGHLGTGDLEIRIKSDEDIEEAKLLIQKCYDVN
jgi:predicted transport protein